MNKILTDHHALDQYVELFGDESAEFIVDIIESFLGDAPNQFSLLESSLSEDDYPTFRRAAHTLKTGCKTIGAPALAEQFLILEEMGANGDLTSVSSTIETCKMDFDQLKLDLAAKIEALS